MTALLEFDIKFLDTIARKTMWSKKWLLYRAIRLKSRILRQSFAIYSELK